jgi:hypothetical protein
MFEFKVVRNASVEETTIGNLYFRLKETDAWTRLCWTLEDMIREITGQPVEKWKIKGRTAIPFGTYDFIVSFSNRFQKDMVEVLGVPGFGGIRFHGGNTHVDTEGCLLVAQNKVNSVKIQGSYSVQIMELLKKNGITKELCAKGAKGRITYVSAVNDAAGA